MKTLLSRLTISLFCVLALCNAASAAVIEHTLDAAFDGDTLSFDYDGDGNMELNTAFQLNFTAGDHGYWTDMTDSEFWPLIFIFSSSDRTGDYLWEYSMDDVVVSSGTVFDTMNSSVHIFDDVPGFSGAFDRLSLTYTLESSSDTGDVNTFDPSNFGDAWFGRGGLPFDATFVKTSIPVPATWTILLLGLGLLRLQRK